MKKNYFLFFILVLAGFKIFAQTQEQKIKEFDAYIEKVRQDWHAPGMAVAVVKDGKVLLQKGYGLRESGKEDKVNSQTLFSCASTTKAMTVACLGILVDEGKIKWEDPVINYLPDYQLYDPFVTRELRIIDLLTHNSGVGNTDFLWTFSDLPAKEMLNRMRLVKPSYSLRSSFIYQNLFYMAAGEVIEKVSGKPWEVFIQERIFTPLGMSRTAPKRKYIKDNNQVTPHYEVEKKIKTVSYTPDEQIGAAGSVWSSIEDMTKWMICLLDSSKYSGGRLLKPATWAMMFRPAVIVPENEFYPTMQLIKPNWTTYALGWFQHDYKGKKINYHTGSLDGLTAIHAQLPDQKLGIYVFGNLDHAEARHVLVYKAFDVFALGGSTDWNKELLSLYGKIREKNEKIKKDFETAQILNTTPSLPLADYAGKYSDPLYGELTIELKDGKLEVDINHFESATLVHWHLNTFRGSYKKDWYGKALATFSFNGNGKIEKINLDGMEFSKTK
ncbi:MAG: serine hydrolase [Bacteroidetes bacterium]|nr:serine hydrolase [Bacteroidota bacterium]MBS1539305.1 serine hydrolase [Bacteroidota bacterium]